MAWRDWRLGRMVILAVFISAPLAAVVAVLIASVVHDRFTGRWSDKSFDCAAGAGFVLLLNTPLYVAAAWDVVSVIAAILLHLTLALIYVGLVRFRVQNDFESFVICLIFSMVISLVVVTLAQSGG